MYAVALARASLRFWGLLAALAFAWAAGPVLAAPPTVSLKSSDLEKRLLAVNKLVFGSERQRLVEPPWTGERLEAFLNATNPADTENRPPSMERVINNGIALTAQVRLSLTTEQPHREHREDILAYVDSSITYQRLLLLTLSRSLQSTQMYVDYKRANLLPINDKEDQALAGILERLEAQLRDRIAVARVRSLFRQQSQTITTDRELIEKALKEARQNLPATCRDSDEKGLNAFNDELTRQIHESARALLAEVNSAYGDVLASQYKNVMEKELSLRDKGKPGEERRDLERLRAHTMAALSSWIDYQCKSNVESLRLYVLRGHCDRQYSGSGIKLDDSFRLPENHATLQEYYDKCIPMTTQSIRDYLQNIDKQMDADEGMLLRTAEWLLIKGPDVVEVLADALVDDLTEWMSDLPATRLTVKEQVLAAAGFPAGKDRIADLTKGEQDQVKRQVVKTYKDIREDFDRDTLYRVRQDLDLLETLQANYVPRTLIDVARPDWPDEPKGRLQVGDCRDLANEAAARAYERLFEQLLHDWEAVAAEQAQYLVKINLKVTYHGRRAAAYKK